MIWPAVTTTGDQSYGQAAVLSANTNLTSSAGSIDFVSTLGGAGFSLTTNSGLNTTFGDIVSGLSLLDATAGGSINVNGGAVTTSGDQTYNNAVVVDGQTASLTSSNGGKIVFTQFLNVFDRFPGVFADDKLAGHLMDVGGNNLVQHGATQRAKHAGHFSPGLEDGRHVFFLSEIFTYMVGQEFGGC